MGFQYPLDLISPLKAEWKIPLRREHDVPPLPPDEVLRKLLEVAYHASFTADEQRATRFTLTVCDPEDATDPLHLDPRRVLDVQEIRRLAQATNPQWLKIAVDLVDAEPDIWGLCSYATDRLEIAVVGSGRLRVGRNNRALAELDGGRVLPTSSGLGAFDLHHHFQEASNELWEGIEWAGNYPAPEFTYQDHLREIVNGIRAHGHGGTMFVLREADAASSGWESHLRIKYRCDDAHIWSLLRESMKAVEFQKEHPQSVMVAAQMAGTRAESLLGRFAGLTRVDGALVMTDRFRLLGFGAEVIVAHDIREISAGGGRALSIENFGTRHRSAFRFCAANPGATAFVCSQDGGVKFVRTIDGKVSVTQM